MKVAVIVRAKDEMPYARFAMDMLHQQNGPQFDLFAVDSGSTDGTLEVLKEYHANLSCIDPDTYVPGKVLNEAIAKTRHDVIVLLNADAIPQSDTWLKKLITPILTNQADAVFSRQVARPEAHFIVTYDYSRAYQGKIAPDFFSAVACAFKRDLWENHPFRETDYAEDAHWAKTCLNDGARIKLVAESVVEHSHNYSTEELFRKRFRQALTFNEAPNAAKQILLFLKEMCRDLLYATVKLKFITIPYNFNYRATIHKALHAGKKQRVKKAPTL